jgi:hypothetical protein
MVIIKIMGQLKPMKSFNLPSQDFFDCRYTSGRHQCGRLLAAAQLKLSFHQLAATKPPV